MNIPFTPIAAIGALIFALINLLKYIRAKDWNSAVTQLVAWGAGLVVVLLVAQAQIARGIVIGGTPLYKLDVPSQVMVGLLATSLFAPFIKFYEAIDNTQTSITPSLTSLPGSTTAATAQRPLHVPPGRG